MVCSIMSCGRRESLKRAVTLLILHVQSHFSLFPGIKHQLTVPCLSPPPYVPQTPPVCLLTWNVINKPATPLTICIFEHERAICHIAAVLWCRDVTHYAGPVGPPEGFKLKPREINIRFFCILKKSVIIRLSWASWTHSTASVPVSQSSILIVPPPTHLGLLTSFFSWWCKTKGVCSLLISHRMLLAPCV